MGLLHGFTQIPWQLKSIFGLLSDTVPINGHHRSPYMILGVSAGVVSCAILASLPSGTMPYALAALLFMGENLNVAMCDVMVDATVAERTKQRPDLAAELQTLCWGSLGVFGVPAALSSGYLLHSYGPRVLFGLAVVCALGVTLAALLGWTGEAAAARVSPRGGGEGGGGGAGLAHLGTCPACDGALTVW